MAVVALGRDGDRGGVWFLDQASGQLAELPEPPVDGWIGPSQAASNDHHVVVNTTVCSVALTEDDDTGFDCPDERPQRVLMVFDRAARTWRVEAAPSASLANIRINSDGTAVLAGADGGGAAAEWSIDLRTLAVSALPPRSAVTCMVATEPALQFGTAGGPASSALLPSSDGSATRSVQLPEPVQPLGIGNAMACYSSDTLIGYPGDPQPIGSDLPDGLEPANRPDATTSTSSARRGTTAIVVHDLDQPGAGPIDVGGTGSVNTFVARPGYLAVTDDDGLHLLNRATGSVTAPVTGSVVQVVALTGGPLAVSLNSSTGLESLTQATL